MLNQAGADPQSRLDQVNKELEEEIWPRYRPILWRVEILWITCTLFGALTALLGYLLRRTEADAPVAGVCLVVAMVCALLSLLVAKREYPLLKRRQRLKQEQYRLRRQVRRVR